MNAPQATWIALREQIRRTAWFQVDRWYTHFATAVPREDAARYREYLEQTRGAEANTRANGYVGLVATNPQAALGRLIRLLESETDPHNRTIIVWCLRFTGEQRAADVLWEFMGSAADVDYGLCLDTQGRVVPFQPPFPLASVEAYKGLIAAKGADHMLDGPGWAHVMRRLERNVDPQPLRLDWERLRPEVTTRESERETAERLMRELEEP